MQRTLKVGYGIYVEVIRRYNDSCRWKKPSAFGFKQVAYQLTPLHVVTNIPLFNNSLPSIRQKGVTSTYIEHCDFTIITVACKQHLDDFLHSAPISNRLDPYTRHRPLWRPSPSTPNIA
jgi:hypothetical protein